MISIKRGRGSDNKNVANVGIGKDEILFYVGLLPFIINFVYSIFRSSNANWNEINVEHTPGSKVTPIIYYFMNNMEKLWFLFIPALVLMAFVLIKMWDKYLKNVKSKLTVINNSILLIFKIIYTIASKSIGILITALYNVLIIVYKRIINNNIKKYIVKDNDDESVSKKKASKQVKFNERIYLICGLSLLVIAISFLITKIVMFKLNLYLKYPYFVALGMFIITYGEIISTIITFKKYKKKKSVDLEINKVIKLSLVTLLIIDTIEAWLSTKGIYNVAFYSIAGIICAVFNIILSFKLILKGKINNK